MHIATNTFLLEQQKYLVENNYIFSNINYFFLSLLIWEHLLHSYIQKRILEQFSDSKSY